MAGRLNRISFNVRKYFIHHTAGHSSYYEGNKIGDQGIFV